MSEVSKERIVEFTKHCMEALAKGDLIDTPADIPEDVRRKIMEKLLENTGLENNLVEVSTGTLGPGSTFTSNKKEDIKTDIVNFIAKIHRPTYGIGPFISMFMSDNEAALITIPENLETSQFPLFSQWAQKKLQGQLNSTINTAILIFEGYYTKTEDIFGDRHINLNNPEVRQKVEEIMSIDPKKRPHTIEGVIAFVEQREANGSIVAYGFVVPTDCSDENNQILHCSDVHEISETNRNNTVGRLVGILI